MLTSLTKLFPKPVPVSLAALGSNTVLYFLWQQPLFNYHQPPLWAVVFGILASVLSFFRIPLLLWLWWLAGAITLLWSMAPGNTLITSLWDVLLLAAFGAGFWRPGFWLVSVLLLAYGLERSLLLNFFGLHTYVSGFTHYVGGAISYSAACHYG